MGKPSWACLSHRSLEGRTKVQQIIIGYFVAPISGKISFFEEKNIFATILGKTTYISGLIYLCYRCDIALCNVSSSYVKYKEDRRSKKDSSIHTQSHKLYKLSRVDKLL